MANYRCDVGLIGMGVMGANFALNIADHGFPLAVYNRTADKTREFIENQAGNREIRAGYTLPEFAGVYEQWN